MSRTPVQPSEELERDDGDDAVIGRALRRSALVGIILIFAAAVGLLTSRPQERPVAAKPDVIDLPQTRPTPALQLPRIPFTDITDQAGIDFVHQNGAAGQKLLPETMGSGCAFFDYDNDGDADLLLVNSCPWPWDQAPERPPTSALYRNDGHGKFENVTAGSGLDVTLYGMGVAIADYDQDGWNDVFLTAVGTNRLFRNEAGKFRDVTAAAGVGGSPEEWSSSAGWFDYDRDGRLDLFVANYVRWSRDLDLAQDFRLVGLGRAYGPPFSFAGTYPYLYRNKGDGTFEDVSKKAGIQIDNPATQSPMAKSLGVLLMDLDRDDWIDVVVANDTVQNFVFHNKHDGTFEEIGAVSGVAFDPAGNARGAMGIDGAYFRNDDSLGIAIGNFSNEMTALYVTYGPAMQFVDEAIPTGLGPPSRLDLKFGVLFADFDLDGRQDLAAVNGHLEEEINKVQASQHYAQAPHLFWNCGLADAAEFVLLRKPQISDDLSRPMVGRGMATADIDGDGDLDLLLTASHGKPRLLRNDQQSGHHWLRVRVEGAEGHRDAIGAHVELKIGNQTLRQCVMPTRGYMSQSEPVVTFGLGTTTTIDELAVVWPDGVRQSVTVPAVDQLLTVRRATDAR